MTPERKEERKKGQRRGGMKLSNPNISRSATLVEEASDLTLKMHRICEFDHSG